jgi:hypothetical protein
LTKDNWAEDGQSDRYKTPEFYTPSVRLLPKR